MSMLPKQKKGLVVGDAYLAVLAAAAGLDYIIHNGSCEELYKGIEEGIEEYGVIIVLRSIAEKCERVEELRKTHSRVLFIFVDNPREIEKIKPEKYYEELMVKYIGMKFNLE